MRSLIFFVYGFASSYSLVQSNSSSTPLLPAAHNGESMDTETTIVTFDSTQNVNNLKKFTNYSVGQKSMKSYQNGIETPKDIRNITQKDALEHSSKGLSEGRGRYKRRKMLKYLQPLLISVLVIKFILLPLTLKALTALSTSSFVMSKIALATAGLFVLKWLLSSSGDGGGYDGGAKERTHFEIVHLPLPLMKPYNRGSNAGGTGGWDDLSLSGSNNIFEIKPTYKRHKYIPVGGVKDVAHVLAVAAADNDSGGGYRSTRPYTQHYDSGSDGNPFL